MDEKNKLKSYIVRKQNFWQPTDEKAVWPPSGNNSLVSAHAKMQNYNRLTYVFHKSNNC